MCITLQGCPSVCLHKRPACDVILSPSQFLSRQPSVASDSGAKHTRWRITLQETTTRHCFSIATNSLTDGLLYKKQHCFSAPGKVSVFISYTFLDCDHSPYGFVKSSDHFWVSQKCNMLHGKWKTGMYTCTQSVLRCILQFKAAARKKKQFWCWFLEYIPASLNGY